jgi:3' terminal RNA ribose 2'-O-methyltransferase Hen1
VRGRSEPSFDVIASELHDLRLETVVEELLGRGATSVVDLGCGAGTLLMRLAAHPQFRRLVGIETDQRALTAARAAIEMLPAGRQAVVELRQGSFAANEELPTGMDAATLVETIEHIDPRHLSRVERCVFQAMAPRTVVVTTPNRDYNTLLGLGADSIRHADHRFEWSREKFRRWIGGVAGRHGYSAAFRDIGRADPVCGGCSQMAVLDRITVNTAAH